MRAQGHHIVSDVFAPADVYQLAEHLSHADLDRTKAGARHILAVPAVRAIATDLRMDPKRVAGPLASELRSMADWLSLESFVVHPKGNLASALKRAL